MFISTGDIKNGLNRLTVTWLRAVSKNTYSSMTEEDHRAVKVNLMINEVCSIAI